MTEHSSSAGSRAIRPEFERRIDRVRDLFFRRDPARWPVFGHEPFAGVAAFRRQAQLRDRSVERYAGGPDLLARLRALDRVPERMAEPPPEGLDPLLPFAAALSKSWEAPESAENVVTLPCDPALYGVLLGSLANPNLVHVDYSGMAVELERAVIRQMAAHTGWDPSRATGIFTQGGTFCNLYGYLLGIRKTMPQTREFGLEHGLDYRILNSQGGHYSNTTNLSLLGVNLRRKTIRIRITDNNDMDMADLERQLTACFELGCVVPAIMLTMGTTDTFGVDRVEPVRILCDRLLDRYPGAARPHLHVDSAIGWPMIFFLDYDFDGNPLEINEATLGGLRDVTNRFRELRFADSHTIDFQKWGYVPYTSSLLMIRDRADLRALEHDPENFTYFDKDTEGQTHLHATIECSRGAAGVFGAAAALAHLGVEGFRILLAHSLQNAGYFRRRLEAEPGVRCVATANHGPSVGFRLYAPDETPDPTAEFAGECDFRDTTAWQERVRRNNAYHYGVFKRRGKIGLFTNYVQSIAHTHYDERGQYRMLPGEKAVFMNPLTGCREIDLFLSHLHG